MNVLVTGGAGFIGSHIVETLLHNGADVRVLDNLSAGSLDNLAGFEDLPGRLEFLKGDLRDADDVRRAVEGVEGVTDVDMNGTAETGIGGQHTQFGGRNR